MADRALGNQGNGMRGRAGILVAAQAFGLRHLLMAEVRSIRPGSGGMAIRTLAVEMVRRLGTLMATNAIYGAHLGMISLGTGKCLGVMAERALLLEV
jgi:hypothetical protein